MPAPSVPAGRVRVSPGLPGTSMNNTHFAGAPLRPILT